MPKKGKNIRCQYDYEDLDKAITQVNLGNMSIRKAAATFGVPKSSIHDRISGRVDVTARPGKQTVFPPEVERMLADKMKEAAEMGFGIDRKQLKAKAARLSVKLKLKTPFKNGVPGDDWVNGFLKRNQLSLRSQVALSNVRSRMLNKTVTAKYFGDLSQTIDDLKLAENPDRIWNMDETSVSLTHKPTKVFAAKGARNVPGRVGNCRESITVLACINAAGSDVPPMVVVKGKTKKSLNSFNTSEGPFGTRWTYQQKGWMEESLGTEWFNHVFVPNIGPQRPQLLIMDSHSSHETLDIIEAAKDQNITLFALPPHTTQWLNPLDKTVFGSFSKEYNKTCTEFMSTSPNNLVCKWVWAGLFKDAYEKTFTKYNLSKGFSACGIFPTDMAAIPTSAFMPSNAFDQASASTVHSQTVQTPSVQTPTIQTQSVHAPTSTLPIVTDIQVVEPPLATSPIGSLADPPVGALHGAYGDSTILGAADEDGTVTLESVTASELLEAMMEAGVDVNFDPLTVGEQPTTPNYRHVTVYNVDDQSSMVSSEVYVATTLPSIPLTTSVEQYAQSTTCFPDPVSPKDEIDSIFQLPLPVITENKPKRKLTSHRILTSDEIIKEKTEAKRRKEEEIRKKEERKIARQIKQEKNKLKKNMPKKVKVEKK